MEKLNLMEVALKNRFMFEYNYWGNFDDFKTRVLRQENEWRKLSFDTLHDSLLVENQEEREKVIRLIQNNQFVVNNPKDFFDAAKKSRRKAMLTDYSPQEYKNMKTFLLKGYDIGYAIKNDGDIVSVFNNSSVRNIGKELVQSAIQNGGTKLDHYDGFLSTLYEPSGFKEYQRYKWDDQYAPANWDYEKFGRPDIVYRKLETKPS